MTAFWIIAGVVFAGLVALWFWADSRAKVRRYVRGQGLDQALKNPEAYTTMMRHQSQGPNGAGGNGLNP